MTVTRLDKLFKSGPDNGLESLARRAAEMGELTTLLRSSLEPELASALTSANLRENGQLVLICESSNWAARLRFEGETLMQIVRTTGAEVSSCHVMVSRRN